MSIAEMQACVARLYIDEPFRKLIQLAPETVLGRYDLTADEQESVRGLDFRLVDQFAGSLVAKRRGKMVAGYPLVFALGSPSVERYYRRYYELHPSDPYLSPYADIVAFGRFVAECLAGDDTVPEYSSDLAVYERIAFQTRSAKGASQGRPRRRETLRPSSRLRLAEGAAVGSFSYDIIPIANALHAKEEPPPGTRGEYIYILRAPDFRSGPDAFAITAPVRELLEISSGQRTVDQVIAEVIRHRGVDLSEPIMATLRSLLASGVLTGRAAVQDRAISDNVGGWSEGHD